MEYVITLKFNDFGLAKLIQTNATFVHVLGVYRFFCLLELVYVLVKFFQQLGTDVRLLIILVHLCVAHALYLSSSQLIVLRVHIVYSLRELHEAAQGHHGRAESYYKRPEDEERRIPVDTVVVDFLDFFYLLHNLRVLVAEQHHQAIDAQRIVKYERNKRDPHVDELRNEVSAAAQGASQHKLNHAFEERVSEVEPYLVAVLV